MDSHFTPYLGQLYSSIEHPLIHVTDRIKAIELIIQNGFRFSYSKETFLDDKRGIEVYYPMISFSDLDWSQAKYRLKSYGQFAISMKKDWAQNKDITPVLYFEKKSNLSTVLLEGFDTLGSGRFPMHEIVSSYRGRTTGDRHKYLKQTIEIASHSKNFYAPLFRKGDLKNSDYSFGAEREWRVVLRNENVSPFLFTKNKDEVELSKANEHFLTFNFSDIEYFVVEAEYEESNIRKVLSEKFSVSDQEISDSIKFHYNDIRVRYED